MEKDPLFAIHKNALHIGNVRAASISEAIRLYLLDSGYSKKDLLDATLISRYKAITAKEKVHF